MRIDRTDDASLNPEQKAALQKLHQAAQQMEGVFLDMVFKEMRKSAPPVTWDGKKESSASSTWQEMLDTKRAEAMAQSDSTGLGAMIEAQLRPAVLSDPAAAVRARLAKGEGGP